VVGTAGCEARCATFQLSGRKESTVNHDRVGRSQDIPDAN
jgi:hypothetical protein